jgi:hypothetical protein
VIRAIVDAVFFGEFPGAVKKCGAISKPASVAARTPP